MNQILPLITFETKKALFSILAGKWNMGNGEVFELKCARVTDMSTKKQYNDPKTPILKR